MEIQRHRAAAEVGFRGDREACGKVESVDGFFETVDPVLLGARRLRTVLAPGRFIDMVGEAECRREGRRPSVQPRGVGFDEF